MRGGQDEVLHFLQACLDDIHRDMLSGNSTAGQLAAWPCTLLDFLPSYTLMSMHDSRESVALHWAQHGRGLAFKQL